MTGRAESFERRLGTLRRVRQGVKLRPADGDDDRGWVARRWLALAESIVPAAELEAGLEYARLGQTVSLQIVAGGVEARVQGRRTTPYRTSWRLSPFTEEQWRQVIDAMAHEAIYAAKLLARELPEGIDALLESMGLRLLPDPGLGEADARCDCDARGPCRHAAAIAYLAADRLDEDPPLALLLRGMAPELVLESLAAARSPGGEEAIAAHREPVVPREGTPPLADCLDSFWRPGPQLDDLQRMPPPHHASHALLRRLGPSPLAGGFPMVGLLASVYDTVAEAAISLRDHAERIDR